MNRLFALLLLLAGCGEPLIGPEFLGSAVVEVRGLIRVQARVPADHGEVALSLFWIGEGAQAEQQAELDSGLGTFSMQVFDEPPLASSLGFGVMALYADRDQDQALNLDADLLLGASSEHLLVWAREPVSDPQLGQVSAGFHLFASNQSCSFVEIEVCETAAELTEVPLETSVVLSLWDRPEEVRVPAAEVWRSTTR